MAWWNPALCADFLFILDSFSTDSLFLLQFHDQVMSDPIKCVSVSSLDS